MGNTCCSVTLDSSIKKIALKLPHGSKGVAWNASHFQPVDINHWLEQLYLGRSWTGYVCYNDEQPDFDHTTKGHCKGILTWNDTQIGWLIHSVPRFPHKFNGFSISAIGSSELIYGQSFLYVEQSRAVVQLDDVLRQILWMKPNFFHVHNLPPVIPYNSSPVTIKTLRWSATMTHLAKSPAHATDFIGTELCKEGDSWCEQTWKRGSEYPANPNSRVLTIQNLCVGGTSYTSSQDHSKWAACGTKVWMGDLNHMKSQEKRGGGGMVLHDKPLATAFRGFVKTPNS
jgi:hypothetical protein